MPGAILFLILGIAGLYYGADWFVGGASSLARSLRVGAAVVGLTVVAFASSTPELITTLTAALHDSPDLGLGNILGSNIANIGLVLGLSALVRPMPISRSTMRSGLPYVLVSFLLLYVLAVDRTLGRLDGVLLMGVLLVFALSQIRSAVRQQGAFSKADAPPLRMGRDGLLIAAGLGSMVVGANLLIRGATTIAQAMGLSETFIAVTLVALGTSLPELATSAVAALKGESEIALANVLGSNVLNIVLVLALVLVITPLPVGGVLFTLHFPAVLLFSLSLVPLLMLNQHISRVVGGLLAGSYGAYILVAYVFGLGPS